VLLLLLLLLLLLAALLAALVLLTGLLAGLLLGLARLAVAAAAVSTTRFGHLYSVCRFLLWTLGGPKSDRARGLNTPWPGTMTANATTPLRILLLDTETNGLPKNRYAPISEAGVWPAILQISWANFTVTGKTMTAGPIRDIGIALDASIVWNTDAAKIHGISEIEARQGLHPQEAFSALAAALREVDVVVAHNLAFDKPVIRAAAYAEWIRGGPPELRDVWPRDIREFCTMTATRDIVCIPSPYYGAPGSANPTGKFKVPRLNELYAWLFGHVYDISGAVLHTSSSDTHCLGQCLSELLRRGIIIVKDGTLSVS
jgi:DNA polymerase III epsilon subunit-like protein